MFRDIKYLASLVLPIAVLLSFYLDGIGSYLGILIAFGVLPLLELMLPGTTENYSKDEEQIVKKKSIFDWLIYINVPIQYGLVVCFLFVITQGGWTTFEIIGKITSLGLACGILGINVAHELGHRHKKSEQFMAKSLLLTSLYMHFFIEHNRGHHKNIATPLDPASSRKGESVYGFFLRSTIGGFKSAWHLENNRLRKKGIAVLNWRNEMIQYMVIQAAFLLTIYAFFGGLATLYFVAAAIMGFLLLETVNYIEHYGLERNEIRPGVYEKTKPWHSWNSNHSLGRIMLYELTRHSDHHFHAGRKYQVLRHFDDAPQMPTGYPGMMVCALIPPLWFKIMNPEAEKHSDTAQKVAIAA